ncbi:MAG: hypothetical protein LBB72_02495, partial [Spirochaetaceae bacterium]|nr:hypothetical protein [Spirochaetaceae bacterium]
MYIDRVLPSLYAPSPSAGQGNSITPNTEMSPNDFSAPERFPARVPSGGVVVDISPEGRAAYERNFPA